MNDAFDRGEIGDGSLAATERLRARLMAERDAPPPPPRRSALPWAAAAALFAFAAGLIANPWFEATVRDRLPFAAPAARAPVDLAPLEQRLAALEKRAPTAPAVAAERLARTEARVESSTGQIERDAERIDQLTAEVARLTARLAAQEARDETVMATAQGAADRAEAMLTVLLLRRAIADGRPLDALMPAARRLFEPRHRDELAALAALAETPATRAGLAADLQLLARGRAGRARPNWWQTLAGRVDALLSGTESDALDRARAAGAQGDLEAAAGALRADVALSRDPAIRAWLASAARLRAAETALGVLEASAAMPLAPAEAAAS
ncbi:MAG: hypothetical protein MUE77_04175 [Sandarakinorhabdus sp.]|jgi:hypothetical protein|nr:hypothetical protein [Sandarakinorhabdus sp.]